MAEARLYAAVGEQQFIVVFAVGPVGLHAVLVVSSWLGFNIVEGVFIRRSLRGVHDTPFLGADEAALHQVGGGVGAHLVGLPCDVYAIGGIPLRDLHVGAGCACGDAGCDGVAVEMQTVLEEVELYAVPIHIAVACRFFVNELGIGIPPSDGHCPVITLDCSVRGDAVNTEIEFVLLLRNVLEFP